MASQNCDITNNEPSEEVPHGHKLQRTASFASSIVSFITGKESSQKQSGVVAYDSQEGKLWMESRDNVPEEKFIRVPIRGTETKVTVSVEVEPKGTKIYIATLNLEKLGSWVKSQRKKGKMQHIYVLGHIPHGLSQLKE